MPFFWIKADQLYNVADSQDSGSLEIYDGGTGRPVLIAAVRPFGAMPRALTIASAADPVQPLASSAPCMMISMQEEICHKLEIRGKDNRMWGTLLPISSDSYGIYQARKDPVLTLDGDQENGCLTAKMGGEIVARAARDRDGDHLEVGVKPHIDPILMLMCVLGVVIFNPEEPEPTGDPACGT